MLRSTIFVNVTIMRLLSIISIAILISQVAASPSGASACPAGDAAPDEAHRAGLPGLVGGLSKGNYMVNVGGRPVAFDGTPINASLDFDITVTARETGFKGILIRVGGTSADQVTSPDLVAPARACGSVGSANHYDASVKRVGTASVSLDDATTLEVDISIVLENKQGKSTFYYSAFQIDAVAGNEVTTSAPVAMPFIETSAPTTMTPVSAAPIVDIVIPATMTPVMVTAPPSTAIPVMVTSPSTTMAPFGPSFVPTNTPFVEESDRPSMAPDGTPFTISDPPSLTTISEPTSDALKYGVTATAVTAALTTLFV